MCKKFCGSKFNEHLHVVVKKPQNYTVKEYSQNIKDIKEAFIYKIYSKHVWYAKSQVYTGITGDHLQQNISPLFNEDSRYARIKIQQHICKTLVICSDISLKFGLLSKLSKILFINNMILF